MSESLADVLPGIFRLRDAVNVYALQFEDGSTCLFDFGSGAVLEAMEQAGLPAPQAVFHTDYRRDRTFGHHDRPGLPTVIGQRDAPFMARADELWQEQQVYHRYTDLHTFWIPRRSIPVQRTVSDGELVLWSKPYVYAQHLGAHTPGGMGYLVVDDGRRYLVSGDLIQADGTLHSIFELQRNYNFMEGLHAVRRAVGWLASGEVDAVLPSHGEPILGADKVVEAARKLLARLADFWERWRLVWPDQPPGHACDFEPVRLSSAPALLCRASREEPTPESGADGQDPAVVLPHLRSATDLIQYAIVDDAGNAALFDTGTGYPEGFEQVLADHGIVNVDVAFITHHHDDHVMGYEWLRERFGTRLAAHECMLDVLQRPEAYALNCLHDRPLRVDIVLREGQVYEWRGYRIHTHHFPSQTEYHCVYFAKVDGVMALFSGDALYWEPGGERIRPTNPDWRNRFDVDRGYLVGAPLLRNYQPRLLAAAHVRPWPISPEACEAFEGNARAFHGSLGALVGRRHPTLGIDPFFLSIYPYRAARQEVISVEVRVDNPLHRPVHATLRPRLPEGMTAWPETLELDLEPKVRARVPLRLKVSPEANLGARATWALRVVFDGEDLGEFCEGMIVGSPE